jgi:uncharacterized protein (TIGR00369 family)
MRKYVDEHDTFNQWNGLRLTEVGDGTSTIEVDLTPNSLNSWNTPHGGLLFAMADVACGVAAVSARGEKCVTASASIDYIAAAGDTGRLTAKAHILRSGRKLCFCAAEVRDDRDTLLIRLNTTMYYTGMKLT